MSLFRLSQRHVVIAAGIALYVFNAYHPLLSLAESLASNEQDARDSITAQQSASDIQPNQSVGYFTFLDDQTVSASTSSAATLSTLSDPQAQNADGDLFEPLLLPGITTPLSLSESYLIERTGASPLAIKVARESDSGFASISINNRQVMKFRTGYDVLDPYDRAQLVAQRLYTHLNTANDNDTPFKALSILPEEKAGSYVIKIGSEVLATIDQDVAIANNNTERTQATVWTNQIRDALGINPYQEPILQTANIIASPGISKKYNKPLSTAFFQSTGKLQSGSASWYGPGFHGRRSSDGSRFDMNKMTAAHRYLPFGTVLKVKNNGNGKICLVQITDRGPFAHGRILDLSKAAADSIGMLGSGTAAVTIEVLSPKPAAATPSLIGSSGSTSSSNIASNAKNN